MIVMMVILSFYIILVSNWLFIVLSFDIVVVIRCRHRGVNSIRFDPIRFDSPDWFRFDSIPYLPQNQSKHDEQTSYKRLTPTLSLSRFLICLLLYCAATRNNNNKQQTGHGTKLRDDSGDEDDGYDEALCPLDYNDNGMLIDDELFDILIEPLSQGVHMVSLMDCCHSGTILDLPYIFKPNSDGTMPTSMSLDDTINLDGLIEQFGGKALGLLVNFLTKSLQG